MIAPVSLDKRIALMSRVCKWCRRRPWRSLALFLLIAFICIEYLAYQHAHAMTHYVQKGGWARTSAGTWTGRPESLSTMAKAKVLVSGVKIARPQYDAMPADVGLKAEPHTFAGPVGDLTAWYVPHEHARGVVLLFHGFGGCKARLLPEAKAFHELGFACFLVDFRGCGGSAGDTTTIGYHEADDVVAAVKYVREHWPDQPVVLFGQSMGAAAIMRATGVLGVEADAVVLECPFDRMLSAVRARFRAHGVVSFPFAESLVFWGGAQHGFNAFHHNPVEYARGICCPVLLMQGSVDRRIRLSQTQEILDHLPFEKELHVFEGLGHHSYVSRRPAEWREQVGTFLERTVP
jgi:alpha-beta hydrolase superfamily lysophospholipase